MKKVVWLVVFCFLLTAFAGCDISSNPPSVTDTDKAVTTESTTESTVEAPTETTDINESEVKGVCISSGEGAVYPNGILVWTEEYKNGECYITGDGFGYYYYVQFPEERENIRTLIYDGELKVSAPPTYDCYKSFRILNSNFEELEERDPSKLAPGEYYLSLTAKYDTRYGDESIKDYWVVCNDYVFKLLVSGESGI